MPVTDRVALSGQRMARTVLAFVALAAVAGWAASFVGLHGFALGTMVGYTSITGWLVPGSFDGAAFACSVLVYRASIYGRSALRGRMLMYLFTAVSGWINWHFQVNPLAQWVGCALPFAAILVFDVVLTDLRAEWEIRHGKAAFRLRLGLLALRWVVDRRGTWAAFRSTLIAVPVTDLVGVHTLAPGPGPSVPVPARPYSGPVPPLTGAAQDQRPVPVAVTEPRPAPRHPVPPAGPRSPVPPTTASTTTEGRRSGALDPMTGMAPGDRVPRPVPAESDPEKTMVMAKVPATGAPSETRTKVHSATMPARRLSSVPVEQLGQASSNEALAAEVARRGGMSRRAVMRTWSIGSDRATKILNLAAEVA